MLPLVGVGLGLGLGLGLGYEVNKVLNFPVPISALKPGISRYVLVLTALVVDRTCMSFTQWSTEGCSFDPYLGLRNHVFLRLEFDEFHLLSILSTSSHICNINTLL